jgi:hypothetical protein
VQDSTTAIRELKAIVTLQELGQSAINIENQEQFDQTGEIDPDLDSLLTRGLFLMSHAVFEFFLQQQVEHSLPSQFLQKRDKRSALERYADSLLNYAGLKADLNQNEWKSVFALAEVRNLVAHTNRFEDREIEQKHLDLLYALGITQAVALVPPTYTLFFFEPKSVHRVVKLYTKLITDLSLALSKEVTDANP